MVEYADSYVVGESPSDDQPLFVGEDLAVIVRDVTSVTHVHASIAITPDPDATAITLRVVDNQGGQIRSPAVTYGTTGTADLGGAVPYAIDTYLPEGIATALGLNLEVTCADANGPSTVSAYAMNVRYN